MATSKGMKSAASAYQLHLFSNVPRLTTRIVRETSFPFCERLQVCSPADIAPLLYAYFRDKDREEFLTVLLDTGNSVLGLAQISVGGLAASIVEPRQVFKVTRYTPVGVVISREATSRIK